MARLSNLFASGCQGGSWGAVRLWLSLLCGLGLAGLVQATPLTLALAHQFAVDSLPDRCAREFANLVERRSKGSMVVAVHPAASFGDERAQLSLMKRGTLQLALTGDLAVSSLSEKYLVVSMPFIYRDARHALAVYGGPLGAGIRQELQAQGLRALSWHHVGTRVLTSNRPVRNLADLQGLELRLPQDAAWMETWRALGVRPRQVPFNALEAALRLGTVQAQENPPNFIRSGKLYQHQKYLVLTRHLPQRQFIFLSEAIWQKLAPSQRQLIAEAARDASRWATQTTESEEARDLEWLVREGGMTELPFDRTGVSEAIRQVPAALAGDDGASIHRQIISTP